MHEFCGAGACNVGLMLWMKRGFSASRTSFWDENGREMRVDLCVGRLEFARREKKKKEMMKNKQPVWQLYL